jgi:dipeptidyl aminopeptidase/acylaminoacyl peptidase
MKPADLVHLRTPDSPALSPDRRTVVFALWTVDADDDTYVSALWRVSTEPGATPVRFTQGRGDSNPRFSPDGRWLAFRRSTGGPAQLYVMPADGGEPWPLTTAQTHPLGVEGPVWDPHSRRIAYVARIAELGRYGTGSNDRPAKEPPRRIGEPKYRREGMGYLDRPGQVYVLDPFDAGSSPVRLTDGDFDNTSVTWSPDGRRLAFASARHASRNRTMISDVFVINLDGSGLVQLTDTRRTAERPAFSADGTQVYFAGAELGDCGFDWFAQHTGAFVVPANGSGALRRLSDPDRHTLDGHFGAGLGGLLFGAQRRGAVDLLLFGADAQPSVVIGGDRQVRAVDVAGDALVAVVADATSAGELVYVDGGGERTLTSYGTSLAERIRIFSMAQLEGAALDGYPVHGWVVKPPGPGPHPVVMLVHGGPFAQYGWSLFDEAQVYAEAGYAVVLGNPRGSSGYGFAHGRYVVGDVGARSAPDLLALLDRALADPDLDGTRVGVLGGSHGGYMVGWLLAHTDRFRTGVSERSINAIDSFLATSDLGWAFTSLYGQDPAAHVRQSPLTYADRITAPMLILHAEDDLRSPFEQAQRLFAALLACGTTVEMVVFPSGGHELSRSGLPSHRIRRFETILDWLARYL